MVLIMYPPQYNVGLELRCRMAAVRRLGKHVEVEWEQLNVSHFDIYGTVQQQAAEKQATFLAGHLLK